MRFRDLRASFAAVLLGVACLFPAACGGGGGGAGGGGSQPPSAAAQFPDVFNVSIPEDTFAASVDTSFPMYAPTEEAPSNLVLTGADSRFFTVTVLASAANASGTRTITLRIAVFGSLSSSSPQDENQDSIYRFKIQGNFRGEALVADINVTVQSVTAKATVIEGDAILQAFGFPLTQIADVTGDGRSEIGLALQTRNGGAAGYVIGSEFFSAMPGGRVSISSLGAAGAKFSQATGSAPRSNMITAKPATAGVDMLLSDAAKNKLYLFPATTSTVFGSLRGLADPDTSADAVVYSFTGGAGEQEGRLIGDVNGDGRNDIFVRSASSGGNGRFGIIFGRAVTSPSDRQREGTFDIEFTYPDGSTGAVRTVAELLSDIDGDTFADLLISIPGSSQVLNGGAYLASVSGSFQGRVWIVRSSVLRGTAPASINLNAMTSAQGKFLPDTPVNSVVEFSDLDGDGYKTLLLGATNVIFAIDAHDLLAAQPGEFGPAARILQSITFISDVGDLDGDGDKEIILSAPSARFIDVVRGSSVRSAIQTAPLPPARQTQLLLGVSLDLSLIPGYTIMDSRPPVVLGSSAPGGNGIIAYGRWCANSCGGDVAGSAGQIVLIKVDDVRPWVNSASVLKVKPN